MLVKLDLRGPWWVTTNAFEDGPALYVAVCAHGLEGIVAKQLSSRYAPNERGWVKLKNPAYWRRDDERERPSPGSTSVGRGLAPTLAARVRAG